MSFPSQNMSGPSEQELRLRAAARLARRRSFTTSAVVVGSLIVLNLFFYAQSHNATWLVLDAVFVCSLAFRAWRAFGEDHREDERIRREVEKMRPSPAWQQAGQYPTFPTSPTSPPAVPPPPPTQ
jgi:hypothetical protein